MREQLIWTFCLTRKTWNIATRHGLNFIVPICHRFGPVGCTKIVDGGFSDVNILTHSKATFLYGQLYKVQSGYIALRGLILFIYFSRLIIYFRLPNQSESSALAILWSYRHLCKCVRKRIAERALLTSWLAHHPKTIKEKKTVSIFNSNFLTI